MGNKCFTRNKSTNTSTPYPKFTYLSTEAAVSIKFTSPDKRLSKKIIVPSEEKLPADANVCKIDKDHFIIVGGINLYRWTHTADTFELHFENNSYKKKADCPYVPYGGSLYQHNNQIYLVGYAQDITPQTEIDFDPDGMPAPFKHTRGQAMASNANLRPAPFLRYSLLRDRWKEVKIHKKKNKADEPEERNEEEQVQEVEIYPHQLLLPGTCKVESRVFFFSGLLFKEEEFLPNPNVYAFHLETRTVEVMHTQFIHEPLTELKCANVNRKRIIMLGGFKKDLSYSREIFVYTIGGEVTVEEEGLSKDFMFADAHPPLGKYKYGVFFGYPHTFLIRYGEKRREYLNIATMVD